MSSNNNTNEGQFTCDFCGSKTGGTDLIPPKFSQQAAWCENCEERLFAQDRYNSCESKNHASGSKTAKDVYCHYVQQAGPKACEEAVLAYFDRFIVAEILLEHIDAEDLDAFMHANLVHEEHVENTAPDSSDDFLQILSKIT